MKGNFNFQSGIDKGANVIRSALAILADPRAEVAALRYEDRYKYAPLLEKYGDKATSAVSMAGDLAIEDNRADPVDGKFRADMLSQRERTCSKIYAPPGYEETVSSAIEGLQSAMAIGTLNDRSRALHKYETIERNVRENGHPLWQETRNG